MTDRQLIDRSDVIVTGTVTAISAHKDAGGHIYTDYTFAVDDVLKGAVDRDQSLTISEMGGMLDGLITFIDASATYRAGDRVLTFLRQRPDGSFYTAGMTRGLFEFGRNIAGEPIVLRDLKDEGPDEPVRLRDSFIAFVRAAVQGRSTAQSSYVSSSPQSKVEWVPAAYGNAKNYSFIQNGFPLRWPCPVNPAGCSQGTPGVDPSGANLGPPPFETDRTPTGGEASAIDNGTSQWSGDANSNIQLSRGGLCTAGGPGPNPCTPGGTTLDFHSVIYLAQSSLPGIGFCDAGIACTVGYAIGPPQSGVNQSFDGDQWADIVDADIVLLPSFTASAPVLAHEIGHAIGFRHSNQGTPSSSNAVMFQSPSVSTLQQWDVDAVDSLYGNGPVAPPCQPPTSVSISGPSAVASGSAVTLQAVPNPPDPGNGSPNAYTYGWYVNRSPNGSPDGTGPTFNTGTISSSTDYIVEVKNACTTTPVDSPRFTITVVACQPPTVITQPQSQSIGSGTKATLSVGVSGTGPFIYQWFQGTFPDQTTPVGPNAPSFTTPSLTKQTSYWVAINNSCGSTNSDTAVITIIGSCNAPQFTLSPKSTTIPSQRQVALVATATGDAPLTYQWYRATAPNQSNPQTGLSTSDNNRWVQMVYVDLLGHTPDGATTGILIGLLTGGSSKSAVASQILAGAEYKSALISSDYRAYLRRDPSSAETAFYQTFLSSATDEDAAASILGSDEYFTGIAGGTNSSFISQLYNDVLGRAPSASDLNSGNSLLTNGLGRTDYALIVLKSAEARTRLVQSWFTAYLRRAGSSGEVSSFVNALGGGQTDEQVQSAILGSTEYSNFGSVLITDAISSTTSYWVRATNNCAGANSANSDTATITLSTDCSTVAPPSIVTQPSSTSTITGVPATVGVGVTGTGPFTFQWFDGNSGDTRNPINNGNRAQLQVQQNNVGTRTVWVRITNACNKSTNSSAATITINCGAPVPRVSADSTVRSGLTHNVSWDGDNTLYSSFELQVANDDKFTNPTTITVTPVAPNQGQNVKTFNETVTTDTRFYYRVRGKALCNGSFSDFSAGVTTLVTAPQPSDSPKLVLNVGGNTTVNVVTQPLFIPGFSSSGKAGAQATGSFSVTSDRDFVTVTPSSGPLPPEGTTVQVNIDPTKLDVGSTQANLRIDSNDGLPAKPASSNGVVVLGSSRSTSTSVTASKTTPVSSTPKDANAGADALIVLAVGHGQSGSGPFQSDVRVTNLGTAARNYQLTFTPWLVDGTKNGRQTTLSINSGETKALNDIVATWFGAGSQNEAPLGTLEVRPLSTSNGSSTTSRSVASSLTYFVKADGSTFGQYIPAIPLSQFMSKASNLKLSLQQVQQNPTSRSNIGLVEGSGQPATAQLRLYDKNNNVLATTQQQLLGFEFLQRALTDYFPGINVDDARLEVTTLSDTGKVSAYASVVENKTSDPTLVFPKFASQVSSTKYVVPGVASLTGANNSNFHTDMRIYNGGSSSVPVTMTFSGPVGAQPFNFTLQPGEVRAFTDVVKQTFNLDGVGGAIVATTQSNTSLVLTARTYSIAPGGGTFGQFIPGVTPTEGVGASDRALNVVQLEQSAGFRSNFGMVEVSGQPVTVRLTYYNPNSKTVPTQDVQLGPNQFMQIGSPFNAAFGAGTVVYNGRISAQVVSGNGRISVYGSLIDNKSNDPAFVPGQ